MRSIQSSTLLAAAALALPLFGGGCTQEISTQQLAEKVGKPADENFFADHAVYMGDKDGYRYVHVRDLYNWTTFLGECDYKIPESQWPMNHPMPLTHNANKWRDVSWLDGDGPAGVPQNLFMTLTPSFPEGAPATQPAGMPMPSLGAPGGATPGNAGPAITQPVWPQPSATQAIPSTQPSQP